MRHHAWSLWSALDIYIKISDIVCVDKFPNYDQYSCKTVLNSDQFICLCTYDIYVNIVYSMIFDITEQWHNLCWFYFTTLEWSSVTFIKQQYTITDGEVKLYN